MSLFFLLIIFFCCFSCSFLPSSSCQLLQIHLCTLRKLIWSCDREMEREKKKQCMRILQVCVWQANREMESMLLWGAVWVWLSDAAGRGRLYISLRIGVAVNACPSQPQPKRLLAWLPDNEVSIDWPTTSSCFCLLTVWLFQGRNLRFSTTSLRV